MKFAIVFVAVLAAFPLFAGDTESQATFSMYCYWTGEATLGQVDGVLRTRIGHIPGSEIVEVTWDPAKTNLEELVAALKRQRSLYAVVARNDDEANRARDVVQEGEIHRTKREPHFIESKYTLRTRYPKLWELGLTERQAIALNSWAFYGGRMPDVLSPEQKAQLKEGGQDE